jgi:7-cyano-7-deazaguanine reductase
MKGGNTGFDSTAPSLPRCARLQGGRTIAEISIDYIREKLCIESKSLKFYLASFRNTRSFNEEIVNRILDDLVKASRPRRAVVHGKFAARGGISVTVDAAFPSDDQIPGHRKHKVENSMP